MVNFGNIEVKGLYVGNAAAQRACLGGETVWGGAEPSPPLQGWELNFTAGQDNCSVALNKVGSAPDLDLEYTTDAGATWNAFVPGTTTVALAHAGDKVWLRAGASGNQGTATATADRHEFALTGSVAADGDVMSLLDRETRLTAIPISHCFDRLFNNCGTLTRPPQLPATALTEACYTYMFYGCTSLTAAPELPAQNVQPHCYNGMFTMCRSLLSAPALPAGGMQNYCYSGMFQNCGSLTSAPDLGHVHSGANYCFQSMFQGCKSLSSAPTLPNVVNRYCCNGMFKDCTSLTAAPFGGGGGQALYPYCYQSMFEGCSSLVSAGELPATQLDSYCYDSMFKNCKSLSSAATVLPATGGASYAYRSMFEGCISLKEAPEIRLAGAGTWQCFAMFAGCSSLTAAPALSATSLQGYSYAEMFNNCRSLSAPPPELPATALANSCYFGMFRYHVPLTSFPKLAASKMATDCYRVMFNETDLTAGPYLQAAVLTSRCYSELFMDSPYLSSLSVGFQDFDNGTTNWMKGVAATGDFYCPSRLGNQQTMTRDVSCVPEGWTVHNPTWIRYTDDNTSLNWVAGEIGRTDFESILARDGKTSADIYAVDFGQDVTAIAPSCFADWGALSEVKIGDNVQSIGDNAFRRRNQISSVQWGVGGNLTAIGPYAFGGVQKVGQYDIPDGVLSIGNNAFVFGKVLSVVTLPQSVTSIGGNCFSNNSALLSVVFHGKAMADVQAMANYPWGASGKIFVD